MDVTGENGRKTNRDISAADHVWPTAEGKVCRPDLGTFDRLMETKEIDVGRMAKIVGLLYKVNKTVTHSSLKGETGQRNGDAIRLPVKRAGSIKDVEVVVATEQRVGDARALVIARNQKDGNPGGSDPEEGRESQKGQVSRDTGTIEEVAPVDHEVDLTREGGCQAHLEIRKEVVTAAAALNPRAKRIVEAQMGIGYEQDADRRKMIHQSSGARTLAYLPGAWATRSPGRRAAQTKAATGLGIPRARPRSMTTPIFASSSEGRPDSTSRWS
jgi:hypothetical protein